MVDHKFPLSAKEICKKKIYGQNNQKKKIDPGSLKYLEEIFHDDKILLKLHYGIEWRD